MAFVRAILLAYEKYGVDPHEALRHARITPAQVKRVGAVIDADQLETLSATAMQELDDEALGWFSRRLPWGTYGMLCRASLASASLGLALARWCRHHRLLTDDVRLTLTAGESDDSARLAIEDVRELGAMREFCLLTSLRYVHGYACWLVNSQLPLREVTFPFAAPRHEAVYPLLFPGPVRFEAAQASMVFETRQMALAPKRDERALSTMLRRALPLTVLQYRRDRLLVERVRELLSDARAAHGTAERLAALLHLSVRSLHRKLAEEGSSLQAIKDDVHRRRALELLRRTSLSIKEVAGRAGFTNEKAFSRAFRQWTGETPSDHRRRAAAGES